MNVLSCLVVFQLLGTCTTLYFKPEWLVFVVRAIKCHKEYFPSPEIMNSVSLLNEFCFTS